MLVASSLTSSALLTRRQYLRFAGLTGLAIASLVALDLVRKPSSLAFGYSVWQVGQVLLLTGCLLGLDYYLCYSPTRTQRWLRRQVPRRSQLLRTSACLLLALLLGALLRAGGWVLGYQNPESWSITLLSSLLFGGAMLAVQSFINRTARMRYLAQENEQFKQMQLQARYESLKQQLSPHFLFNSLTTLRGLIYEDPADAERFVEEMAHVYRYLLLHSEHDAVALRDELEFLHSYAFLIQRRFGQSLRLNISVPGYVLDRLVPPLALQMLVENAVKHNVVGRQYPLHLYVELSQPNYLQVRHVRRPRLTPEPSNGIGLRNLANRVRLLHQAELLVETDTEFRVSLPLPA